ncbi:hypothetical protein [Pseudochryseolinea flava]|uniref:Uncharacterized protein n=1 Tax=Pseudochryseolinea flava TaxID=2059302 RepID=A0A364Y1G0_9BACT|nr:hypothetical protein [Pseudochryseolinea flava]RAW00568.1 hypothetical protein DQQ10_13290 [Pseudochryseolinea flava]
MQMTKEQELDIYREAIAMKNQGKFEPEIRSVLKQKGLDDAYITNALMNIYRLESPQERAEAQANAGSGTSSMVIGGLICVGGIIATMATNGQVLFYGAIIVGAIQFIKGLVQASNAD